MRSFSAKTILEPREYRNYRNVRIAAVVYTLVALSIAATTGTIVLLHALDVRREPEWGWAVVHAAISALGAWGAIATLCGNRRFGFLVYTVAVFWSPMVPIGTVLAYITLRGLNRYLDACDRLRNYDREIFAEFE